MRIVQDLHVHDNVYLDDTFLTDESTHSGMNLSATYAKYSPKKHGIICR